MLIKELIMSGDQGYMLVVDDNKMNRMMLSRALEQQGHRVAWAENGWEALKQLRAEAFDVVLLDILMPEMDGYQVLEEMKRDKGLRHIPVIMISSLEDTESIVRCIEMGADDYLTKPFDPVLLRARINACLAKKRLHDLEQEYIQLLQIEQEKSERLLLNILPKPIAERLKQEQSTVADSFAEVTVLFADIVDFTRLSAHVSPRELVELLNRIFSVFDKLAEKHGLEKIKTIGDAYMVVGGLPTPRPDHAEAIAEMAIDMQNAIAEFRGNDNEPFSIRIGIHTGPVVAGVIGTKKFVYDLWGDTVNTASRMETQGLPGSIQVTGATYERLRDKFVFEERGVIDVKGKGKMQTYLLMARNGQPTPSVG
jgi:adenylate cyclase